mmetsp:Transcript_2875/g.4174  ORF Transcript_2875/g.4174 Transcript_2875/m.4174 type:complete len:236 (+) Transcript_2875:394-1101(+)
MVISSLSAVCNLVLLSLFIFFVFLIVVRAVVAERGNAGEGNAPILEALDPGDEGGSGAAACEDRVIALGGSDRDDGPQRRNCPPRLPLGARRWRRRPSRPLCRRFGKQRAKELYKFGLPRFLNPAHGLGVGVRGKGMERPPRRPRVGGKRDHAEAAAGVLTTSRFRSGFRIFRARSSTSRRVAPLRSMNPLKVGLGHLRPVVEGVAEVVIVRTIHMRNEPAATLVEQSEELGCVG